jgi:hypothetical protein
MSAVTAERPAALSLSRTFRGLDRVARLADSFSASTVRT